MASPPPENEYEIDPSDYELISRTFDHVKNIISYGISQKNSPTHELWYQKVLLYSLKLIQPLVSTTPAEVITEVLESLRNLVYNSDDTVKLLVLMFLSKSAMNLGKVSQMNSPLAHALTTILLKLMESQDKIISSSTLDVWLKVVNPQLKETVSMDSDLNVRYSTIMNAQYDRTSNSPANMSFPSVLNSLPETTHCCSKRDFKSAADVDVPPAKKFKADSMVVPDDPQITGILLRLHRDSALLKSTWPQHRISLQLKIQLEAVIKNLSSVVDDMPYSPDFRFTTH